MIEIAAATWAGKRTVHEDFCAIAGGLIVLADGAGGLVTGVLAARLAALTLMVSREAAPETAAGDFLAQGFAAAHDLIAVAAASEKLPVGALAQAVEARLDAPARSLIAAAAAGRLTLSGMFASTLACVAGASTLHLAHLGNLRAYRLRDGVLRLLTTDHALPPPYQHLVLHALGAGRFQAPQQLSETLVPGDRYLLCTDGLHRFVDQATLTTLLSSPIAPAAALERLREAAQGSDDNLGAVVMDAGDGPTTLHNDPPWPG